MPTEFPAVKGYGDFDVEPFEEYYARWPAALAAMPKCVVESWVYRHWTDFQSWIELDPAAWKYSLSEFTNEQIMAIDHFGDWRKTLDHWGSELLTNRRRQETWLAKSMLDAGTVPAPIIVAVEAGHVRHPRGLKADFMKEPYQLIEGHMRLAYLRGMNTGGWQTLKPKHLVWAVEIPRTNSLGARRP